MALRIPGLRCSVRLLVLFLASLLGVFSGQLPATPPPAVLMKDIAATREPYGSGTGAGDGGFCAIGNTVYFGAADLTHGHELWKTDGTEAGTVLVKDIFPGAEAGIPGVEAGSVFRFAALGQTLYFHARDPEHGEELWKSDGTEAGTVLVKDINPGLAGSELAYPTVLGQTLYFLAKDAAHGVELWKTDGTEAGTVLVKDFNPGPANGVYYQPVVLDGTLYLFAADAEHGYELWKSDGTEAGTTLVKDIRSGSDSGAFGGPIVVMGHTLYFVGHDAAHGFELCKSDGTEAGTVLIKDIYPGTEGSYPTQLTAIGDTLFFAADDSVHGKELWKSDGTEAGTVLLKDLTDSPSGYHVSDPILFTAVGNTLYFAATDPVQGSLLWKSDGTEGGTVPIKNFAAGSAGNGNGISRLISAGSFLYLIADDSVHGDSLWKSDGTAAGTVRVNEQVGASRGSQMIVAGTLVYFTGVDAEHGYELWKSDGTAAGTAIVKDIIVNTPDSGASQLTVAGDTLFFSAADALSAFGLWKTDGTPDGTTLLLRSGDGSSLSQPEKLTALGGTLFFVNQESTHGAELWKSDGAPGGTTLLKDINPGSGSANPDFFASMDGLLYFQARLDELWKTDGTPEGTVLVKDFSGSGGGVPARLAVVGHTLYFEAYEGTTHGRSLWKSDGTEAGTVYVSDFGDGGVGNNIANLTAMGDTLFFIAGTAANGVELWKSDGTEAGTVIVKDIGGGSAAPSNLTPINGTLYFVAYDSGHGRELWKTDGTEAGTMRVKDIAEGVTGSAPSDLIAIGDTLYFVADDAIHGKELWKSDGTEEGTVLVRDIYSGLIGSAPSSLTRMGNALYFAAIDPVYGRELWKSDGTEAGTVLQANVAADSGSSSPRNFAALGSSLFFTATTEQYGEEVYRLETLYTEPVVTLLGNQPYTFEAAVTYTDAGAAATDAEDGTLVPVITRNTVISNRTGTYQVTWTATDRSGATGAATRTVTVVDHTPPTASATPAFLTAGPTGIVVLGDQSGLVTASDIVTAAANLQIEQSLDPSTVLPLGTYSIGFTVTDEAGNFTPTSTTVTVAFAPPAAAGDVAEMIHSGTTAPGAGTGDIPDGALLSSFGSPALSDFRALAARATLTAGRLKLAAIYQVDGAGVAAIPAIQNGAVPGSDEPAQTGLAFKSFLDPVISPSGAIAFAATVKGAKPNADQGVWTDAFGPLAQVLREGSDVPGLPAGVKLKSITSLALRDGELIAFVKLAPARGLVVAGKDDTAVVSLRDVDDGTLLLRTSPAANGTPGLKTISILAPALGSPGQGRWVGENHLLAKLTFTTGEVRLVKISEPAVITPLLSSTASADAIDAAARWKKFGVPAMGCDGYEFTVHATLAPQSGVVSSKDDTALIFSADPENDPWTAYAREGDLTPISSDPNGPRYASFFDPVTNEAGQVAFLATLQGGGVKATNKTALFTGSSDNLRLVARLGTFAPDETGQLNGGTFSKFTSYALTSSETADGNLVVLGETTGSDLPKFKQALWATVSTGQFRRILRTGIALTPNGSLVKSLTLLAATPGSTGTARSYNETASVVALVTFVDKTQALVRIDLP